jgi:hypothetical protein
MLQGRQAPYSANASSSLVATWPLWKKSFPRSATCCLAEVLTLAPTIPHDPNAKTRAGRRRRRGIATGELKKHGFFPARGTLEPIVILRSWRPVASWPLLPDGSPNSTKGGIDVFRLSEVASFPVRRRAPTSRKAWTWLTNNENAVADATNSMRLENIKGARQRMLDPRMELRPTFASLSFNDSL